MKRRTVEHICKNAEFSNTLQIRIGLKDAQCVWLVTINVHIDLFIHKKAAQIQPLTKTVWLIREKKNKRVRLSFS